MRAQLERLVEVAKLATSPSSRAVQHRRARRSRRSFTVPALQRARGCRTVYIEQLTSALPGQHEDVDHYLEVMNHLSTEALTPRRARSSSHEMIRDT